MYSASDRVWAPQVKICVYHQFIIMPFGSFINLGYLHRATQIVTKGAKTSCATVGLI